MQLLMSVFFHPENGWHSEFSLFIFSPVLYRHKGIINVRVRFRSILSKNSESVWRMINVEFFIIDNCDRNSHRSILESELSSVLQIQADFFRTRL